MFIDGKLVSPEQVKIWRKKAEKLDTIKEWENRWGHHIKNPHMKGELMKALEGDK